MPELSRKEINWSRELFLYCVAAEWFLYGINVVLFCFCVRTLYRCRLRNRRALFIAVSAIFLLCTIHWALQLVNAAELLMVLEMMARALKGVKSPQKELVNRANRANQLNIAMGAVYVLTNLIADSIFIYRCYCIWDFRKRIIVVPSVLLVACGGLGFASVIACGMEGFSEFLFITIFFPLSVIFSVLTNVILMALAAGRIWWIGRGARAIMGPAVVKQYRTVIAMILESGALYCTPGLMYLAFFIASPPATQVIFAALAQIVGIAPTIIVVRVGLGNSVDSVESFRGGPQVQGTVLDIGPDLDLDLDLDLWDQKANLEMV
ncbi:hypothetical protein C8F04DRAFT_1136674 [Mycena alexandri]|uniref:Uncharacterized protein n=1 Tax=Mycena alexandri TaxID=1745969 RepID=A0AAD6WQ00_9AGAR|nr:hypothetical protein C8F04DRAFT_1136674 [Mycena alexandri]